MSITTLTGFSHPSWAIFHPRPAPWPGSSEPSGNEIGLANSCSTSGQHAPNHGMLFSSRTGMMRLASNTNDPTTATTPFVDGLPSAVGADVRVALVVAGDHLERTALRSHPGR